MKGEEKRIKKLLSDVAASDNKQNPDDALCVCVCVRAHACVCVFYFFKSN